MKKLKYVIMIIVLCLIVFIGVEVFKNDKREEEKKEENTNTIIEEKIENDNKEKEEENNIQSNTENNTQTNNIKGEIKSGSELEQKAEKTLTARGWMGASNNMIGLKEGVLYLYNKETKEFKTIATGIEDIYYKTELAEDITVKKGSNAQILDENVTFLIYE